MKIRFNLGDSARRVLAGLAPVLLVAAPSADVTGSEPLVVSEAEARRELDVTVYNQNLALVHEVRSLELPAGDLQIEFRDVPAQIEPRSLLVEVAGGAGLRVLEQNYEFDLMSKEKILEKYVGKELSWIQEDGERVSGRLLGMTSGPVYEVDGEIVFEVPGRIALPTLPENLRARPTLVWRATTHRQGDADLDVSYLTRGLSWSADYVLQLDAAGTTADLRAWVSLDNRSGASFASARLLLVAGEIHQAPPSGPQMVRMAMAAEAKYAADVTEESLYDYHLYTLAGRSDLKDSQIKQISLFEAAGLGIERRYRLESPMAIFRGGGEKTAQEKVNVYYAFDNREDNNLGLPLPAGVFRVYGQAGSGSRQLLGEDRINHTPKDEEVELQVGVAFDLTAKRVRSDYRRIGDRVHESTFEITLRNHKDEDVVVEVREFVGGDWRVLNESHPHQKLSSTQIRFEVPVPADGQTVLNYTVQVTY